MINAKSENELSGAQVKEKDKEFVQVSLCSKVQEFDFYILLISFAGLCCVRAFSS